MQTKFTKNVCQTWLANERKALLMEELLTFHAVLSHLDKKGPTLVRQGYQITGKKRGSIDDSFGRVADRMMVNLWKTALNLRGFSRRDYRIILKRQMGETRAEYWLYFNL